jgi:fibronectin-binding autotransporter adhesin
MNPRLRLLETSTHNFSKTLYFRLALLVVFALSHASGVAATLLVVTGPDAGHAPVVKLTVNTGQGNDTISLQAYRNGFRGGVRVAVGDVNGDGVPDIITAPGPGMGAHIRVFDGRNGNRLRGPIGNFLAYPGMFRGGVFVAAGDVNGDGRADIIVGPDNGAPPLVRVFDGRNGNTLQSFFAYSPFFTGGVRVAAGDVNGDGRADIITGAGPGAGSHVKVFSGTNLDLLRSFFAYDQTFLGGVYVAAGDVNGDSSADIITGAGPGGGPHVRVFDGGSLQPLQSFFAFDANFQGGVRVAAGDVNGDGFADIITGAGPGGGPHVKVFDSHTLDLLHSFFAYEPNFAGGVFVGGVGSSSRQR